MTAKHTPGPWEMPAGPADKNTSDIFEVGDYNVYPPPGEAGPVAIVAGEANAHLISAAPELYEALEILADYPLEEFAMENKPDYQPLFGANNWQLTVCQVRAARKALAKARGEA